MQVSRFSQLTHKPLNSLESSPFATIFHSDVGTNGGSTFGGVITYPSNSSHSIVGSVGSLGYIQSRSLIQLEQRLSWMAMDGIEPSFSTGLSATVAWRSDSYWQLSRHQSHSNVDGNGLLSQGGKSRRISRVLRIVICERGMRR